MGMRAGMTAGQEVRLWAVGFCFVMLLTEMWWKIGMCMHATQRQTRSRIKLHLQSAKTFAVALIVDGGCPAESMLTAFACNARFDPPPLSTPTSTTFQTSHEVTQQSVCAGQRSFDEASFKSPGPNTPNMPHSPQYVFPYGSPHMQPPMGNSWAVPPQPPQYPAGGAHGPVPVMPGGGYVMVPHYPHQMPPDGVPIFLDPRMGNPLSLLGCSVMCIWLAT